jgi:hypothetical protein
VFCLASSRSWRRSEGIHGLPEFRFDFDISYLSFEGSG